MKSTSKLATPVKLPKAKEISPNDKTMTSTALPEKVSHLTYEGMITQSFKEVFLKNRKYRDQGVTYQTIWKQIQERHKEANKKVFLQRLKKTKVLKKVDGKNRYKIILESIKVKKIEKVKKAHPLVEKKSKGEKRRSEKSQKIGKKDQKSDKKESKIEKKDAKISKKEVKKPVVLKGKPEEKSKKAHTSKKDKNAIKNQSKKDPKSQKS